MAEKETSGGPLRDEEAPAKVPARRRRASVLVGLALALALALGVSTRYSTIPWRAASHLVFVADSVLPAGLDRHPALSVPRDWERRARQTWSELRLSHPAVVIESVPGPSQDCPEAEIFWHQPLQDEALTEFVQAAGPLADWEDPLELANRLRELTGHGPAQSPPDSTDPLRYLELAARSPMTCRYFAVLQVALLSSRGYTARLVGLSSDGSRHQHAVAEVFLPDEGRWVLIDPDFNIAYRTEGRLLNALDLQRLWQSLEQRGIAEMDETAAGRLLSQTGLEVVALGSAGEELRRSNLGALANLPMFEFVTISPRDDYVSRQYPPGHPARWLQFALRADGVSAPPPNCPECVVVTTPECLYRPVGRTLILPMGLQRDRTIELDLRLLTDLPNLAHFEISLDGGEWRRIADESFAWSLGPGRNEVGARAVNLGGVAGPPSRLAVTLSPAQTSSLRPLDSLASAAPREAY